MHDFTAEDGIMLALSVSTASVTALSYSLSSVRSSPLSWAGHFFRYPMHGTETLEALHTTLLHIVCVFFPKQTWNYGIS